MSISWSILGKILTIRAGINESCFVLEVDHPVVGFLGQLSQGTSKAFGLCDPLQIVHESEKEDGTNNSEERREFSLLLSQVEEGLLYHAPELVEEGVNGTYFMRDKEGKVIAIFKPKDEEGSSANNPKRLDDEDEFLPRGILVGDRALREVAAYQIDKGHFSGVPETVMATLNHPSFCTVDGTDSSKTGSLQAFVENDGASWDVGPSRFPVREVHKIGILDLRIFNNDRHGGNILMRENDNGEIELVPIDHGLSLTSTFDRAWFDWLMWPQAKQPFDEETRAYIYNIDVEADASLLLRLGIKEECVRTMIVSTTLLKQGAAAGMTLYDIASMVCREDLEKPSLLEQMLSQL